MEIQTNLEDFKKIVRKAVYLTNKEDAYFNKIPDETWSVIFEKNFNNNYAYAQRVLLNKHRNIEQLDDVRVNKEKTKITNFDKAVKMLNSSYDAGEKVLFITDFDNDGSLSQAIINEFLDVDATAKNNSIVQYAQVLNGNANRGFTLEVVDKIAGAYQIGTEQTFTIVTADNGINSADEQKRIQDKYKNAKIIVTDHHNPEDHMVIKENDKTVIFNPKYKPTEFYKKFNISGATTIGALLNGVLEARNVEGLNNVQTKAVDSIQKISKISNLLDYVETDPADKPQKDYEISKFLKIQPLMNINNAINKIITGEMAPETITELEKKIPSLNTTVLFEEAKNIHIQNYVAKILIDIYEKNRENTDLNKDDLDSLILNKIVHRIPAGNEINPNYIEQLRPIIFRLSANDEKSVFLDSLNQKMIDLYETIKISERKMIDELRKGEVVTKVKSENSIIAFADPNILTVFNRKFLNKAYNDANPGFSLTLDSVGKGKVSGSFRSLYDISYILKNKKDLEKQLDITIDTPGHERAAGFIVKSKDPVKNPITPKTIEKINEFINNSIKNIKENEINKKTQFVLTDFEGISIIDKINQAVRGNISHFERISPIIQLNKDTIWTDSYTTQQFTMSELVADRKYGYVSVKLNFDDDTVIIPTEVVRSLVNNNFKDYLSLSYMDGGVFMAEKVIPHGDVQTIIDARKSETKSKEIDETFAKYFTNTNILKLDRDQIKDNPFFKYHDYGQLNFDLFERMVIEIIDSNKIDTLTVFDVEANGFGNSKLINIGSMNYQIDEDSGATMSKAYFDKQHFYTQRGEEYLLTNDQIVKLKKIKEQEKDSYSLDIKKKILIHSMDGNTSYYLYDGIENKKIKTPPFLPIKNSVIDKNKVIYNREIKAEMISYLVHDTDFRMPQEMTNLTGITQELLEKYGKNTKVVDQELAEYYKDKKCLFGAHNTPYDTRVLRVNCPLFSKKLSESMIYDSAIFSKKDKLAYDDVKISNFENIDGLPKKIYFYNNEYSDFNLSNFIDKNVNGYYPDRTNSYFLEIANSEYLLVDKIKHEIIKLNVDQQGLLDNLRTENLSKVTPKYSVEKLSEQWMIHALMLCDEPFNIKHVDLSQPCYNMLLKHHDSLSFFQDNYHFDSSPGNNISYFKNFYPDINFSNEITSDQMRAFLKEFLTLNSDIQQKFSDGWIYKKVLEIKEPQSRNDLNNDLFDLINFQTAIPKDKIKKVFEDALKFKEKYKIDHIIHHESHVNGLIDGDHKGDIAFEDKLTLALLAQKYYNSYKHSVEDAVMTFNRHIVNAKLNYDINETMSDEVANDAYSFRQALQYNRNDKSPLVQSLQNREQSNITGNSAEVIKFKLDNGILIQDMSIYAIKRPSAVLTREIIEEDKKKLSFIALVEQLKTSNVDTSIKDISARENVEIILKDNLELEEKYKTDLSQRYSYIEYSKKDFQVKEIIDTLIDCTKNEKLTKIRPESYKDIDAKGWDLVENSLKNYITNSTTLGFSDLSPTGIANAMNWLTGTKQNHIPTSLEQAMNLPNGISSGPNIIDNTFFRHFSIQRKKPIDMILDKFISYRLINNTIEKNNFPQKKKLKI